MIKKAREVRVIKDYLLLIIFDGDEERIFDCELLLTDKRYSALVDQGFFKTVYVDECGIVSWSDAINLNPFDAFGKSVSAIQFSIIWFFEHYDELTEQYGHKFLVIYAGIVEGAYDDRRIALEEGGKKHRLGTYIVQETGVEHIPMMTAIEDYTEWQKDWYDDVKPEDLYKELNQYSENHEFKGRKAEIV